MSRNGETVTVPGTQVGPSGPTEPAERAVALRLARLHLRLGSLGLARAELEACAGSGELDEAALLDLAEVRWRTGDLPGAGEAAAAAIATGDQSGLALVIAAEAAAASSRPAEARRLAGQALEATNVPLDQLFAGMPQSSIWPHDARPGDPLPATDRGPGVELGAASAAATTVPTTAPRIGGPGGPLGRVRPSTGSHGHVIEGGLPAAVHLTAQDTPTALGLATDDLAAGRTDRAASRLALLLRVAPDAAERVLAVADPNRGPAISLVRGDALRLLGRESEASAAYASAATALGAPSDDVAPPATRS